jgi:hypothetical protein
MTAASLSLVEPDMEISPIICGAPHIMSELFTYGSVGGVGGNPGPYPAAVPRETIQAVRS